MRPHLNPIGQTRGVLPFLASAICGLQLPQRRVPRTRPDGRHDQPTRLNHLDARVLEAMPASAVIGIGTVPLSNTPKAAEELIGRGAIARTALCTAVPMSVKAMADTDRPLAPALKHP